MKKIALLGCTKRKLPQKAKVKNLYQGSLFKLSLAYGEKLGYEEILVLSAKHGLLELDTEIEPYDLALKNLSDQQVRLWAEEVLKELKERFDLEHDHFIFFAGHEYRKYLIPQMASFEIPMEGLSNGKQLHYLREHHE